jgi:hypothetical protein
VQRLYKFFLFLFLGLFLLSYVFAYLISWGMFKVITANLVGKAHAEAVPFEIFLKPALFSGLEFALVQFLIILFLFRYAMHNNKRFTARNILHVSISFFISTAGLYFFYCLDFLQSPNLSVFVLLLGPQISFPPVFWAPFLVGWIVLYFIFQLLIKKQADGSEN